MSEINIDDFVDYQSEYEAALQKVKVAGDRLTSLCPFHDDKNASFSVDLKTGKYICFACGMSGNFISFYASTHGIDTKYAYKEILERYHVGEAQKGPPTYTVEDYATEKKLPVDWLKSVCHLDSGWEKTGEPFVKVPYFDAQGKQATFRKRYRRGSSKRFAWKYGSAGKLCLYGLWRLEDIKKADYAVLCEGESDTQTLWMLGISALGVPGASTYQPEWTKDLADVKTLYLHIEPDRGGETFLSQMTQKLKEGEYKGTVKCWSCSEMGAKDPSDLYLQKGKGPAEKKIREALAAAKPIDIYAEEIPEAIAGAPVRLRQPPGWLYSDAGIFQISEKTYQPQLVCRTPIILTRRLRGIDTGDEKIEVAWKRDDSWKKAIFPRSTIFNSRNIGILADLGCTITSENSKLVVRFLEAMEAENMDILGKTDSTSSFGWQPGNRFLPGLDGGIALDLDPSLRYWADAYNPAGTFDAWKDMVRDNRLRSKFRFVLAASFAAPLLRILRQRIMMVYNWGGSKSGKTAALKAALSVWGDPSRLMFSFNSTNVAIERMAALYCDLPLGIDERQLAGGNQQNIERLVYMIAEGKGKNRGAKTGGLQQMQTWRTICIGTGEEPIARNTSQTGVSTRVLELYGGPFSDEREASMIHQLSEENFGWAGPEFVRHVLLAGESEIKDRFACMLRYVNEITSGKNGAHASGIAAIATADALVDEWIFGNGQKQAEMLAKGMAFEVVKENAGNEVRDVNDIASQYVTDWILSNYKNFGSEAKSVCYGEIISDASGSRMVYVYPSILNKVLDDAGYSPRKTIKYMAENGYIVTSPGSAVERYSITYRILGSVCRVVQIDLDRLLSTKQSDKSGFLEVENQNGDLPF